MIFKHFRPKSLLAVTFSLLLSTGSSVHAYVGTLPSPGDEILEVATQTFPSFITMDLTYEIATYVIPLEFPYFEEAGRNAEEGEILWNVTLRVVEYALPTAAGVEFGWSATIVGNELHIESYASCGVCGLFEATFDIEAIAFRSEHGGVAAEKVTFGQVKTLYRK